VPRAHQKVKLPAHVERAALLSERKQKTYTMLSDDDSDASSAGGDARVDTTRQVH